MSKTATHPSVADQAPHWANRRKKFHRQAFTLAELMVSMVASALVVGALVVSSMSLRRGLQSNEQYTDAYADQRRVTDYIGRDLRRAVAIATTDDAGQPVEGGSQPFSITIAERASLIVTIPAYYRSNTRTDSNYEVPFDVVDDAQRLDYGTSEGVAPSVTVSFRKMFCAKEGCVCFVRQEASTEEVIVRHAENLSVQVMVEAGAQAATIRTWFRPADRGPKPLVSTHDRLLLRNPPATYQP